MCMQVSIAHAEVVTDDSKNENQVEFNKENLEYARFKFKIAVAKVLLEDSWIDKIKQNIADRLNVDKTDIQITIDVEDDSENTDIEEECVNLVEINILYDQGKIDFEEYLDLYGLYLDQQAMEECY